MNSVTYADLMARAITDAARGTTAVRLHRFDDRAHAREALAAYHGLLAAIEAHTWAIIAPARLIGASTGSDPVERVAVAIASSLRMVTGTFDPHPSLVHPPVHPWSHAAVAVRAASDLLAVHHTARGVPRSPDAVAWADRAARTAALADLGTLVGTTLDAEDTLALRAGQAHLSWTEIGHWLPDLAATRADAARLAASNPSVAAAHPMGRLTLISDHVRTDTPVHELTDRITQVRRLAWNLQANPDHSTATLHDLATFATAIHAHAAAHLASLGTPPSRAANAVLARAVAWQQIGHHVAAYYSPAPAHPEIRAHTRVVIGLLRGLAPLRTTEASTRTDRGTGLDDLTPALRAAIAAAGQTSESAAHAFTHLADRHHLAVRGAALNGNAVSDDPDLVTAKLTRARATAPFATTQHTRRLYRRALGAEPVAGHRPPSPIEVAIEPMTLSRTVAG